MTQVGEQGLRIAVQPRNSRGSRPPPDSRGDRPSPDSLADRTDRQTRTVLLAAVASLPFPTSASSLLCDPGRGHCPLHPGDGAAQAASKNAQSSPHPGGARAPALRPSLLPRPLERCQWVQSSRGCWAHLGAEVGGPSPLCCQDPAPSAPLPPSLGLQAAPFLLVPTRSYLKPALCCLRHPRGAAHPGRSLCLIPPPAITPSSLQAAISAEYLQGRKKGREERLLLNTEFYSRGDDTSRLKARRIKVCS